MDNNLRTSGERATGDQWSVFAANIARRTWYRRINGIACRAEYYPANKDRPIAFIRVDEPGCAPRTMPTENFFCFYSATEGR